MGRSGRILTPNELDLTFLVSNYGAKFHQNRLRIATVGQTDRRDRREWFIISVSVPCYAMIKTGQPLR